MLRGHKMIGEQCAHQSDASVNDHRACPLRSSGIGNDARQRPVSVWGYAPERTLLSQCLQSSHRSVMPLSDGPRIRAVSARLATRKPSARQTICADSRGRGCVPFASPQRGRMRHRRAEASGSRHHLPCNHTDLDRHLRRQRRQHGAERFKLKSVLRE